MALLLAYEDEFQVNIELMFYFRNFCSSGSSRVDVSNLNFVERVFKAHGILLFLAKICSDSGRPAQPLFSFTEVGVASLGQLARPEGPLPSSQFPAALPQQKRVFSFSQFLKSDPEGGGWPKLCSFESARPPCPSCLHTDLLPGQLWGLPFHLVDFAKTPLGRGQQT